MKQTILTMVITVVISAAGVGAELTEEEILGQVDTRIERYRKGEVIAKLYQPDGTPLAANVTVKISMIPGKAPLLEKFQLAKEVGFEGVSLFAPDRFDVKEALQAQEKTGLMIHNVNNAVHWKQRLSDPDRKIAICGQSLGGGHDLARLRVDKDGVCVRAARVDAECK